MTTSRLPGSNGAVTESGATSKRIGKSEPHRSMTAARTTPAKRVSRRSRTRALGTLSTNVPFTSPTGWTPANHVRQTASETWDWMATEQPSQSS